MTERKPVQLSFERLLEAAPDPMVIVDREGRIVLVNAQVERQFGYAREEILGQPVEVLVPAAARAKHPEHRANYVAHAHPRPMGAGLDLHGCRKDGSEFPVDISLSPMESEGETFVTATIRDITERKRAQTELARYAADLERSNQDLDQFAYVASHDLQEPLRTMASFSQLLARKYKGRLDADADEFIGYVVDGATRMQALINDLLAYSRVGRKGKPFVPTDAGQAFDRALVDLSKAVEESGGTVTRDTLPTVTCDDVQLERLFQNLIANAVKFRSAQPPKVHVSARREGSGWLFSVQDNGIGIDGRFKDRLFVIFQRLHAANEYPGTGMGLAISKKIVERHGGRIWVESEPGKGSSFFFTLPDAPPPKEGKYVQAH